ncbi:MAG: hypothetical protein JXR49_06065 [Acidobacteria bacterium]|nr:hypothetical protein [Acidobacteriota bacterium]
MPARLARRSWDGRKRPINSYVVADELLRNNVGFFAVTAFLVTWVTVGLVQIPAEASALGKKFALLTRTIHEAFTAAAQTGMSTAEPIYALHKLAALPSDSSTYC